MPPRKPLPLLRPGSGDSFLERICKALDKTPEQLADRLGVPYSELAPLLDDRHRLVEIDRDEVWWKLNEYVGDRIAAFLAIRMELNKALTKDRTKRAVRIAQFQAREPKGSPRGRT
jgi:plasmid maintenance system antidote protein VapI